jgi:hypothetical protein
MAQIMKHVGVYGEKPCVVVFRELPDDTDHALVCMSNTLDGQFHDDVMSVVDSQEGQESNNISDVLFRRRLSDGENMLEALHNRGKLLKVPVDMVKLTPLPNQTVELKEVNAELNKIANNSNPPLKTEVNPTTIDTTQSIPAPASDEAEDVAQNLLAQAELLEDDAKALLEDAKAKKAQAYELAPELAPKRGPGRPPKEAVSS